MNTNSTSSSCRYGSYESRDVYKVEPCRYSAGSLSVCASYPSMNTPCNLCLAWLWIVVSSDQAYRQVHGITWSLRQCTCSSTSLHQSFSHLKPEFYMGESSTCCHLAVGKISIDKRDINKVKENLLPPLFLSGGRSHNRLPTDLTCPRRP